jgi:hypothetical protein
MIYFRRGRIVSESSPIREKGAWIEIFTGDLPDSQERRLWTFPIIGDTNASSSSPEGRTDSDAGTAWYVLIMADRLLWHKIP